MGLWHDIRFAARLLVKDKWFTLVATIALALGIGVNTAVFTFVNAVLIRGLPFDDPETIMALNSFDRERTRDMSVSYLDFKDWAAARSLTGLTAFTGTTMNVSDEGRVPERFTGAFVSATAFKTIGQTPLVGRDFLPEDDRPGAPAVVLLGNGVWKNRYASDPAIVGRTIRVNDVPSVVIGVMREGLKFPSDADLWQPISMVPNVQNQKRNSRGFEVFGRLAPGVSLEQARSELLSMSQQLARDFPETNKNVEAKVQPFHERVNGGPIRAVFLSLMGAVAFVLLIACANVANLLLSRAAQRSREVAVRVSLGATRWRIVRQLLAESLMLSMMSAALGLGLGVVGIRMFDAVTQDVGKPSWIQFTLDGRVFAYLALISLGTAIAFGLAPALHVSKTDVNEVLKEGGRSGSAGTRVRRWSTGLIIGELALTLALLAGAGFMMRNFLTLYQMNLGIDTSRLLMLSLALPDRKYPEIEQRRAFYERLQERLVLNPAFKSVTVTSNVPLQGGFARKLEVEGRPLGSGEQPPMVTMLTVDPRYFETVGLPIVRGQGFGPNDGRPGQERAIINARFAQMHFPKEDPLGRRITLSMDLSGGPAPQGLPVSLTAIIVGVTNNVRQRAFSDRETDPVAYLPFRMDPRAFMTLLARTEGDPKPMTQLLREEVRALDPDLPLFGIRTMDETLARSRWPFRVFGTMFAIFAVIALVLSAVGLYAVTAFSVTQRTQEIGIRTALGAGSRDVMWMFLKRALIHLGVGLTLGVAAAFGVGKIFESANLLVQTNGRDPVTIGSIAALLAMVALTASLWPARRAARLDPLAALRRD